ncbi:MAG: Uma2 family endonuclease [Campylobacterales bacterium]|nr:Uma2 family endonuclease [Campylobacterales bacterium]
MGARKLEYLPHYTYDDYVRFEGQWELIGGIPYNMAPAPMKQHQFVSGNIAWMLKEALKGCERCCSLLPVDYKIDESTIVQPDNLVVCDEPLEGAYITKAPLIIFEVLSKATALKDQHLKFELYEREGVRYYVIVDPMEKSAKLYRLHEGRYIKEGDFSLESYTFDLLPCKAEFDFSKIWN